MIDTLASVQEGQRVLSLASLRKSRGLTQSELARRLGVGRVTIARWETGAFLPSTRYLQPLAEALGVHRQLVLDAVGGVAV